MRGNNYAREPSSAFRGVLQTQLRSPVKTRGDTHETALVILPVQRVRASSLRVRVIASNAFLLRALLRTSSRSWNLHAVVMGSDAIHSSLVRFNN